MNEINGIKAVPSSKRPRCPCGYPMDTHSDNHLECPKCGFKPTPKEDKHADPSTQ